MTLMEGSCHDFKTGRLHLIDTDLLSTLCTSHTVLPEVRSGSKTILSRPNFDKILYIRLRKEFIIIQGICLDLQQSDLIL